LLERLQVSEARAKADSKGLWAESGGKVESSYELKDAKELVEKYKGQGVDGGYLELKYRGCGLLN
jgi:staphylococcal nuclease domain-containing protein 1